MDFATILNSLLNATGRLGLTVALTALAVYGFRSYGVEPFSSIPADWFNALVIAGIFGAVVVALSSLAWTFGKAAGIAGSIRRWRRGKAETRARRDAGLKNLRDGYVEFRAALHFLYCHNTRRFVASSSNELLAKMARACILERDDPPDVAWIWGGDVFYLVPDHIWEQLVLNDADLRQIEPPERAPWLKGWPG